MWIDPRAGALGLVAALSGTAAPAWAQQDLRADSAGSLSAAYRLEDDLRVQVEVTADSGTFSGALDVELLLSTDAALDAMDRSVGVQTLSLPSAVSSTVAVVEMPSPQLRGTFQILARLDPNQLRNDPDRSNDVAATPLVVFQGTDPSLFRLVALPQAFLEEELLFLVDVRNDGPSVLSGASLEVYLTPSVGAPFVLFDGAVPSVASNNTWSLSESAVLPPALSPGTATLTATLTLAAPEVDSDLGDNFSERPIQLRRRVADLEGTVLSSSTALQAGQDLAVSYRVDNAGFVDAPATQAAFVLSEDAEIRPGDLELARAAVPSLGPGEGAVQTETVRVPLTTEPGAYRLGMLLDPDARIEEVDEANNQVLGPELQVFAPDLQVVTSSLPVARRRVPYEAGLLVVGGPVARYGFQVAAGRLPADLELGADGIVSGVPRELGTFPFVVRVTSGGAFAERALSMQVIDPTVELSVFPTDLGQFVAGRPFSVDLVAVGGAPPYAWTAAGELPADTDLSEVGRWAGTVEQPGPVAFRVQVTDAFGERAEAELTADFLDPEGGVMVLSGVLPPGVVGVPYCETQRVQIPVAGSNPPFRFSAAFSPPGLELSAEGELCGTPSRVGTSTFTVNAVDALGLLDSGNFTVRIAGDGSVRVAAEDLPEAQVGTFYERALTVSGGVPPYGFDLLTGELPVGVELTREGRVAGTPEEPGLFLFAVSVRDARGVIGRAPLSLVVREARPSDDGCGCRAASAHDRAGPGGLGGLAIAALAGAGLWLWRRRGVRG